MKTGFTLIELLIALVLLDVGVLALVGLAASISRNGDDSRLEANALSVGTARVERTASKACRGATRGTVSLNPGMTERFAELPLPNDTRVIIDSVSYKTTRGPKTIVLQTGARC
ncbi:MAG TPA: prepilin-type N-terminal cleavage/methylation domain-containing protein [Gemmatimonadaceae bacterium]|nr:prepilin-type N-terminal cleavage/methylation domain-containing protein [Gemmatimonadaceae bacterium]